VVNKASRARTVGMLNSGTVGVAEGSCDGDVLGVAEGEAEEVEVAEGLGLGVGFGVVVDD
jgi:hypothetical protein